VKYDVYIVVGVILTGLSLPAIFGAMADRRVPYSAMVALAVAAALIGLAVSQRPGVYGLEEIPHAFVRVIAGVRNALF
jgi:hypothetical protein